MDGGVTINRPPRDGHMAFVRTPDNISIELLQDGRSLPPAGDHWDWSRCAEYRGIGKMSLLEISVSHLSVLHLRQLMSGWSDRPIDNYVWLVRSGETMVVDPAVAEPVLAEAAARGWTITADLEHPLAPRSHRRQCRDQGGDRLHDHRPGGEATRIPTLDVLVRGGRHRALGAVDGAGASTFPRIPPGISPFISPSEEAAFVGDTLFAMGCGRLFEGTAEQMFANMRKLEALADDTASIARMNIRRAMAALR